MRAHQLDHRCEQLRIGEGGLRRRVRQARDKRRREQRKGYGAEHVHPAPAQVRGDEAAGEAGEQDAEKQRGEHRADRAAALARRRQLRHHRHDDLRIAGAYADGESRRRGGPHVLRSGRSEQGAYAREVLRDDQAALVEAVAERHEKQDPDEKTAEAGGRNPADGGAVRAELGGHGAEHRRLVVDAARSREGRGREQQHQAAVQWRGDRFAGRLARFDTTRFRLKSRT